MTSSGKRAKRPTRKAATTTHNKKHAFSTEGKRKRSHKEAARTRSNKKHAFPDKFVTAFDRWKGGAAMVALAREMGERRRVLKRAFIGMAGSREAFDALRQNGAGGKSFGGKRPKPRTKEQVRVDDSTAVHVNSMRKSRGWSWRYVYEPVLVMIKDEGKVRWRRLKYVVHVSPRGNEYVEAKATERADLIHRGLQKQWGPDVGRFRRLAESAVVRHDKQEEAERTRGEKARNARKRAKMKRKRKLEKLADVA